MVGKKINATNKLRIQFVTLMYLIFISLWADGLYKIGEAEKIIKEQEEYIAIHNRTQEELNEAYSTIDCLRKEKNHTEDLFNMADDYATAIVGQRIDWEKAMTIKILESYASRD